MKILVTGGAGFIGSNLVGALLEKKEIAQVRVLDNLSNGYLENISGYKSNPKFEFVEGDIENFDTCLKATAGVDKISHQAALGSVPRSIANPLPTHASNATGTLNLFRAAIENGVERVVFASSSSVYGDNPTLPKVENKVGNVLSPYALTKKMNERYAEVFALTNDFKYIGLRYFNVFGPNQSPNGPYAAVIPIFMSNALKNQSPTINGDGSFSRDFTYVANAVEANMKGLFTDNQEALNQVYNVAFGQRTNLNELWDAIKEHTGCTADVIYGPERSGDIPHSLANIEKAKALLGYDPKFSIQEGMKHTVNWFKDNIS